MDSSRLVKFSTCFPGMLSKTELQSPSDLRISNRTRSTCLTIQAKTRPLHFYVIVLERDSHFRDSEKLLPPERRFHFPLTSATAGRFVCHRGPFLVESSRNLFLRCIRHTLHPRELSLARYGHGRLSACKVVEKFMNKFELRSRSNGRTRFRSNRLRKLETRCH